MNNYENHYKDRKPELTIQIIQKFFNDKNLTTKEVTIVQSEINTWSSVISLYDKNNTLLMSSNGKGMTKEYSLASGYGELYERYCNFGDYINFDPYIHHQIIQKRKLIKGYYYTPEEKEINVLDNFFKTNHELLTDYYKPNEKEVFNFLQKLFNNKCIGVPYTNFITQEVEYFNPFLIQMLTGSGGMCAGNTLEEALNQGLSELFEHYVAGEFFALPKDFIFHYIDTDNIQDENIQQLLTNIRKLNKRIEIIDLSYNFNVPVVMSLLINQDGSTAHVNFGAFPVFEIAVERVLTELYQGIKTYDEISYVMIPDRNFPFKDKVFDSLKCITLFPIINEQLFLNKKTNCSPNKNIFLFKNTSNYDNNIILTYYKNLCEKNQYHIYYLNNSQTKDMYALQVYGANLSHFPYKTKYAMQISYPKMFHLYLNYYNFEKELLETGIANPYYLKNILNNSERFNREYSVMAMRYLSLYENTKGYEQLLLLSILEDEPLEEDLIFTVTENTFLEKSIKKYLTIYRYAISQSYTEKEKQLILKELLNEEISQEEINMVLHRNYFFNQACFKPIYEHYHSEKYQEVLKAFI